MSSAAVMLTRRVSMVDHKQIDTDWAARGFSCELWVDLPGRR
jgi:hypothetical protein